MAGHYLDNVVNGLAAMMPSDSTPTDTTTKEPVKVSLTLSRNQTVIQAATEQIQSLAEEIVLGDVELDNLNKQVKAKEEQVYKAKKALYDLLASAG
jgi:hypothetical protein